MFGFLKMFKKTDPELQEALRRLQRIETTKPEWGPLLTGSHTSGSTGPPGGLCSISPATMLAQQVPVSISIRPTPEAMLSISSPDGVDSIVLEANGKTIMEAWDTKAAMVDRPIGSLGFAKGLAYVMTRGGWVNMGEALDKPLEMTDRRGAIRAQKERKRQQDADT